MQSELNDEDHTALAVYGSPQGSSISTVSDLDWSVYKSPTWLQRKTTHDLVLV